jgi:site-specific recombinase XerD
MERLSSEFLSYLSNVRQASVNTVAAYENDLRQFADFMGKERPNCTVEEVDRNDIRAFIAHLLRRRLSSATVYRRTEAVRSFFQYLSRQEIVPASPVRFVESPKREELLPVWMSEKEVRKVLALPDKRTLRGLRDATMMELFYSTGIRLSELRNLNLRDADFEGQTIKVYGKGQKERIVPVGSKALIALKLYLESRSHFSKSAIRLIWKELDEQEERHQNCNIRKAAHTVWENHPEVRRSFRDSKELLRLRFNCFKATHSEVTDLETFDRYTDRTLTNGRSALFLSTQGKRLCIRAIDLIVKGYITQACPNLSRRTPHVFRHSFATHMLNRGADIVAIGALLGHASLSATQIYTHVSVRRIVEVYRRAHPKSGLFMRMRRRLLADKGIHKELILLGKVDVPSGLLIRLHDPSTNNWRLAKEFGLTVYRVGCIRRLIQNAAVG